MRPPFIGVPLRFVEQSMEFHSPKISRIFGAPTPISSQPMATRMVARHATGLIPKPRKKSRFSTELLRPIDTPQAG